MCSEGHLYEGNTMTLRKPILSARTKAALLWCLAVHAQGPTGALAFTPTGQCPNER
jgi:hypothetical protein